MESIIEKNMFGMDKIVALARALGFNPGSMMVEITPDELTRIVLKTREEEIAKHGAWWGEVLDLQSYIYLMQMYRYSPEQQRKAYTALIVHIRSTQWPKYEKIVKDPAFGFMDITPRDEGGETDDVRTSSGSDGADL